MRISFFLFDKNDNEFKKVYFEKWEGLVPYFASDKRKGKFYINEKQAKADIDKLKKARSDQAKTLNITLED